MSRRRIALACTGLALATACSDPAGPRALQATASPTVGATTRATAGSTAGPTPSPTSSPTSRPTPTPARVTASPTPSPAARRTAASVPLCPRVPAVRATQVVLVEGRGSSAVIRACERKQGRWVSVLGTMHGHVGLRGVAPPGEKREGDRRTPSGTFPLGRGFGVRADPGTWFSWQRTDRADVWVDDPGSDLYNTWQRKPANGRWDSAEDLYVPGTYDYVQVVDYNTARVPGKGSAIFLHVDHDSGTYGCISLPRAQLLSVFRWERPGALMVIR